MSSSTWDIELIRKRDTKIVERFSYLYDIKRKRFDDTIKQLKWEEFFLKERTLKSIIRKGGVDLPYREQLDLKHPLGISLTEARNNKLVERFTYLTNVKRMRIDDVILQLSKNEFYLREVYAERIAFKWNPITEGSQTKTLFD
jgi:hypothetical protein